MDPDPGTGGPARMRAPHRRPGPTREEILAARRARRIRTALFAFSLTWAFGASVVTSFIWPAYEMSLSLPIILVLVPSVFTGLASGRRMLSAYAFALLIVTGPMALFQLVGLIAVWWVCMAVVVLGAFAHALLFLLTLGRWRIDPGPEVDAPRGTGLVSTKDGGVQWKKAATIASAAPTGSEYRKRIL